MTPFANSESVFPRENELILRAQQDARELTHQAPDLVQRAAATSAVLFAPGALPDYEIKEEIHRGGQGVVYRALHTATGRAAAVKILRGGAAARAEEQWRFAREIQILEQLRHPHIVAVRAHGVAGDCHYFVMDYVAGRPLDQWIFDLGIWNMDSRLSTEPPAFGPAQPKNQNPKSKIETVLRLFAEICEAVHAAHLRGVIHRDLKPRNILVTEEGFQDSRIQGFAGKTGQLLVPSNPRILESSNPQPKILDFGLAKLTPEAGASGPDALTQTGLFIGSLPWASPEQAAGDAGALDLRTDVYSLGVMFYQLLVGRFPYETRGKLADAVNNILHAAPARPRALRPEIGDELETILLKCLNKEPERRYQTAGELARDLRHLLAGEPIEAKRDSGWYMFKKTMYKYRGTAAAAAAVALVILIALLATTLLWRQARRERDRAIAAEHMATQARMEAEKQRELAQASAAQARQEMAKAEAVRDFLQNTLTAADPAQDRGRNLSARDMLDEAAQKIERGALQNEPQVQASVRGALGNTYRDLGQFAAAEAQLRAALALRRQTLGDAHPDVAASLNDLALLLHQKGDFAAAEPLYREALTIQRKTWGDNHPQVAQSLLNLAQTLRNAGRPAEAEALLREALERQRQLLGPKHPAVATTLAQLGDALRERGAPAEAEPLLREALAQRRELLGADHPETLESLEMLGRTLNDRGDNAAAEALFRESLELRRKVLGPQHPALAATLRNLAALAQQAGRLDEAGAMLQEALTVSRKAFGNEHPQIAEIMARLAAVCLKRDDLEQADALCRDALNMQRKLLGDGHPQVLPTMGLLGKILTRRQQFAEGETVLLQTYEAARKQSGERAAGTVQSLKNLVELYDAWGKPDQAAAWGEKLEAATKKNN